MGFWERAADYLPLLMEGVWLTLAVTFFSVLLSTLLGFVWAVMTWTRIPILVGISRGFVTIIRGIPIIVQLFYIYFVMPEIGINLSAMQAGIIGLGIAYSAYQAENFRAGIEAIDKGQIDQLVMRRVIIPQAIRIVLPPYGNTIIMVLKDSSLVSTITVAELTRQGQLIAASTFDNMTVFTLVALIYLALSLPLTFLTRHLEKRYSQA